MNKGSEAPLAPLVTGVMCLAPAVQSQHKSLGPREIEDPRERKETKASAYHT